MIFQGLEAEAKAKAKNLKGLEAEAEARKMWPRGRGHEAEARPQPQVCPRHPTIYPQSRLTQLATVPS